MVSLQMPPHSEFIHIIFSGPLLVKGGLVSHMGGRASKAILASGADKHMLTDHEMLLRTCISEGDLLSYRSDLYCKIKLVHMVQPHFFTFR